MRSRGGDGRVSCAGAGRGRAQGLPPPHPLINAAAALSNGDKATCVKVRRLGMSIFSMNDLSTRYRRA
jgi:hypothetical protein